MVRPGTVLWLTGLSGAGKSTIARECHALLQARGPNVVYLDGDVVRQVLGDDLGHAPGDRLKNAWRICRLSRMLSDQGQNVVVATMSLFHDCHQWNRDHMPGYFEVYLRVPIEVARQRDPKGLYRRFDAGETSGIVGLDLPFDEPLKPDLIIDNAETLSDIVPVAHRILEAATSYGHVL